VTHHRLAGRVEIERNAKALRNRRCFLGGHGHGAILGASVEDGKNLAVSTRRNLARHHGV
jgi:hypothetical protein